MRHLTSPARRAAVAVALIAALMLSLVTGKLLTTTTGVAKTSLRIWYATDDPTEAPLVKALALGFQTAHPGSWVQLTTYALDDMNSKLQLALSSGNGPDLIYTTPRGPGLPVYLKAHLLLDLTDSAHAEGWASSLRPGLLQSYNDALSSSGSAANRVYAVPYVLAAVGVLYNTTIFHQLHLEVPHTVEQLAVDAGSAHDKRLTAFGVGTADGWLGDDWYLTLVNAISGPRQLAPELHLDPNFSFNGPSFIQAGQLLRSWAARGYFTPQFGGLDAQDSVAAFFQGKTAMQLISSTENGQVAQLASQTHIHIGIFAFPSVDARTAPVMPQSGYAGWAIPKSAHQTALAKAFISQMLTASTSRALLAHGLLPARTMTATDLGGTAGFQRSYLQALSIAAPGIYLDGAPVPNLNATMEANVQLVLQQIEAPEFLVRSLQTVYASGGVHASNTRTDGEF